MLLQLIRYYSYVLKNGNPKPDYPPLEVPYGRTEINMNQHWYGFTALALVCGLAIGVSGILFWSITREKTDFTPRIIVPFCGVPLPPPPHQPHVKGELALGTKVSFIEFQIPKPAPRNKVVERGIRKDIKVRDPKEEVQAKDWICKLHLPDSIESKVRPLDLSLFTFDFPESKEGEVFCFCSHYSNSHDQCLPEPLHDYSVESLISYEKVDEEPIPINLDEVKKMIKWPKMFCGSGTVVLRIQVNKFGSFSGYKVVSEAHPLLTHEVTKHIDRVRFTPAIWQAKPVASAVNIPFRFRLVD